MPKKYQPKDFKTILEENPSLSATLGKWEYENFAANVIKHSIEKGDWVTEKSLRSLDQESSHFVKVNEKTYTLSESCLEQIMKRNSKE